MVSMDARPSARADTMVPFMRQDMIQLSQWMPGRARGRTGAIDRLKALQASQWMPGRARGRTAHS